MLRSICYVLLKIKSTPTLMNHFRSIMPRMWRHVISMAAAYPDSDSDGEEFLSVVGQFFEIQNEMVNLMESDDEEGTQAILQ